MLIVFNVARWRFWTLKRSFCPYKFPYNPPRKSLGVASSVREEGEEGEASPVNISIGISICFSRTILLYFMMMMSCEDYDHEFKFWKLYGAHKLFNFTNSFCICIEGSYEAWSLNWIIDPYYKRSIHFPLIIVEIMVILLFFYLLKIN